MVLRMTAIKLCECGCGKPTTPVRWAVKSLGHKRGDYRRFIRGHSSRKTNAELPSGILVDSSDLPVIKQITWRVGKNGYASGWHAGDFVLMHRLLTNAPAGICVDHINGNKLDNRRSNLRLVTHAENLQNRPSLPRNNTSGHRGVSFSKKGRAWVAQAHQSGRTIVIGRFHTKEEAATAASAWRAQHMPGALEAAI